ncbi:MAG: hypothetical protein IT430_07830 [Phycisphaerales bacterium]|nr:hypothetical protein [Phycisphaerales bacterium]
MRSAYELVEAHRLRVSPLPQSPAVIEFVGIPGSGKTTIARALLSALDEAGVSVRYETNIFNWTTSTSDYQLRRRWRRLLVDNAFIAAVRNPALYFSMLRFALSIRPFTFKNVQYGWLILGWVRRTSTSISSTGTVNTVNVQDEGALHLLTRLAMYGDRYSESALRSIASQLAVALPRIMVVVSPICIETAVTRYVLRKGLSLADSLRICRNGALTFEEAVALRRRHQEAVKAIAMRLHESMPGRLIQCLNDDTPIQDHAAAILDALPRGWCRGADSTEVAHAASPS